MTGQPWSRANRIPVALGKYPTGLPTVLFGLALLVFEGADTASHNFPRR